MRGSWPVWLAAVQERPNPLGRRVSGAGRGTVSCAGCELRQEGLADAFIQQPFGGLHRFPRGTRALTRQLGGGHPDLFRCYWRQTESKPVGLARVDWLPGQ